MLLCADVKNQHVLSLNSHTRGSRGVGMGREQRIQLAERETRHFFLPSPGSSECSLPSSLEAGKNIPCDPGSVTMVKENCCCCRRRQMLLHTADPETALLSLIRSRKWRLHICCTRRSRGSKAPHTLRRPLDLQPSLSWPLMVAVQSTSSSEEPAVCWLMFTPEHHRAAFNHSASVL